MAQEGQQQEQELTAEQKAVLEHGRVSDLDAAAAKLKAGANKDDDKTAQDQAAIDAENAANAAKDKSKDAEKAAEEEKPKEEEDNKWQEQFVVTNNEHADAVIELLKESGVKPVEANEFFKNAIETGDLTKIRWDLIEARLGSAKTKLARAGVEAYYNGEYKQQMETQTYAFEKVGGEEGWNTLKTWINKQEKSDPKIAAIADSARKSIAQGGWAAQRAIDGLKELYEADPKNGSLGNKPLERGKSDPAQKQTGDPLSRRAYYEAVQKAGGDRAPEHVKKALWSRRQAGIASGI